MIDDLSRKVILVRDGPQESGTWERKKHGFPLLSWVLHSYVSKMFSSAIDLTIIAQFKKKIYSSHFQLFVNMSSSRCAFHGFSGL